MTGKIIIYGGKGALGSVIVQYFKNKQWWVGCVDLVKNDVADKSIVVSKDSSWAVQTEEVLLGLKNALGDEKVDAVINVAGGWAGGNAAHKDFRANCELMAKQSIWSSTISAEASTKFLKEGGLLVLPGAKAALEGTPGMMGYGMAKAAIHQLTKSLSMENSGLPTDSTVVALLPITLDTPMNRKWMSKSDFTSWTSLEFVAELLFKWTIKQERPVSGSLVQMVTKSSKTELIIA